MDNLQDSFTLMGIKLSQKTKNENGQSSIDGGQLWTKFMQENILDKISNKLSNTIYAVYYDYDTDYNGTFDYFIGCKVSNDSNAIEGLEILNIPAQHYQLFTAKGKMTECISDVWLRIWDSTIKRAYGFDIEVYDERSKDWSDAVIDIHISI